jgi:hypothetical protein
MTCVSAISMNVYLSTMFSTDQCVDSHSNTITSHCILRNITLKHERRGSVVGIGIGPLNSNSRELIIFASNMNHNFIFFSRSEVSKLASKIICFSTWQFPILDYNNLV